MKRMWEKMFLYAPDGAEGGGASETPSAPTTSAPAESSSYESQFGTEANATEKPLDLDKIKPLYDPLNLEEEGEPETIEQPEETAGETAPKEEEAKPAEPPKPDELEKVKAEYEEYKKGEEQRFNNFYAALKQKEQEQAAVSNQVENLFKDEAFVKQLEEAPTGNDVAKLIMAKNVEMTQKMLETKLAPVFALVQSYQKEQEEKRVNEVFGNFRAKYGQEADRALTPGTPEHKALVAELQANPTLPLEKAFLLVKPNFVQRQVQSEVKKAIDEKRSMAIAPSTGKSNGASTSKIDSPRDALLASIREIKTRNRQD